jgi:hypothetical protein
MIPPQFYYLLVVLGRLWLFVVLPRAWPSQGTPPQPQPPMLITPRRMRSHEPTPFAGLTHKPPCVLGEQEAASPPAPPPGPPAPPPPTHRRPRTVATARHFCPQPGCRSRGWLGPGKLRAHGHPHGGPWRPFHCTACHGYCLETHGTLCHGTRGSVDLIVHVLACLAAGLGLRGTARLFEIAPNTVRRWVGEAAAPLRAFTA